MSRSPGVLLGKAEAFGKTGGSHATWKITRVGSCKSAGLRGVAPSCGSSYFFALDLIVRHMISFASPF